jgi:hypothetical protein
MQISPPILLILTTTTTLTTAIALSTSSSTSSQKRQEGAAIPMIGSARSSAFDHASSALAAQTPLQNQIVCPAVIGAETAAVATQAPAADAVTLRVDPLAVSFLEERQSVRPHQSRGGEFRGGKSVSSLV